MKTIALYLFAAIFCGVHAHYWPWQREFGADVLHQNAAEHLRHEEEVYYGDDNLHFNGTGWRDNQDGWGFNYGVGFRFRRRRSVMMGPFHLLIKASPCQFAVYDSNKDGVITREELRALFDNVRLADSLFSALDTAKEGVDRPVSRDVFNSVAAKLIYGCQ